MKKPLIGIAAIFCLQVVFVAYNAADPFFYAMSESANRQINVPLSSPKPAEVPNDPLLAAAAFPDPEPDPVEPARPRMKRIDAGRVNAEYARHRAPAPRPLPARAKTPRPGVVVAASRKPEPPLKFKHERPDRSEEFEMSAGIETQKKGKSFFGKAFSVIKKPYNWAKAVGSAFK